MAVQIRRAGAGDAETLTAIAYAAKRHWDYPEEWIKLWEDELTVDPGYVEANEVFVAEDGGAAVGWCSVAKNQGEFWLDYCWVLPEAAGRGIGEMLVRKAFALAPWLRFDSLKVVSDPNAEGFYRKMGFRNIGKHPSKPDGRCLPILEVSMHGDAWHGAADGQRQTVMSFASAKATPACFARDPGCQASKSASIVYSRWCCRSQLSGGDMVRLSTYLLLDGSCKEAMGFYQSLFGGELSISLVGDTPMKAMFPPEMHNRVINASLKAEGVSLSASDWMLPSEKPVSGNTVCLYISGGTVKETRYLFDKLSDGARVTDPFTEQPFGFYGALNDKFGIRWMFHSDKVDALATSRLSGWHEPDS